MRAECEDAAGVSVIDRLKGVIVARAHATDEFIVRVAGYERVWCCRAVGNFFQKGPHIRSMSYIPRNVQRLHTYTDRCAPNARVGFRSTPAHDELE